MPTVLITGASSGIGLAFLHAYAKDPMNTVITCDKDALPTPTSSSVKTTHHLLDITSTPSIAAFAQSISGQPVDLVIYSIGVRGLVDNLHNSTQGSAQHAETLEAMDLDTILSTFHINTASAFLFLRSILPNLRLAQEANSGVQPKVVVMSSRMGSLAANTTGAGYAYRASKAALNAIIKSFSIDVPEVTWVLCHPGRVESALVRYKEDDAISAEESVRGLLPIIEKWDRSNSGNFYDRFGVTIQW